MTDTKQGVHSGSIIQVSIAVLTWNVIPAVQWRGGIFDEEVCNIVCKVVVGAAPNDVRKHGSLGALGVELDGNE